MTKSRVGQPHPIRTNPVTPVTVSARTIRALARADRHHTPVPPELEESDTTTMTTITVARTLTSADARGRRATQTPEPVTALDQLPTLPEEIVCDPGDPGTPPDDPTGPPGGDDPGPPGDDPGSDPENPLPDDDTDSQDITLSNRDLARAILSLAKRNTTTPKKSHLKPNPPTPFSGGTNEQLRSFLYECELAFNTNVGEYSSDREKIFYAISYLRGSASGFFQPFILDNGSLPVDQQPEFLRSWEAFREKLTQQFGSYSPEDDDETQLYSIVFPENGRATDYFIKFGQYENRVHFGGRGLRFIAKQALPPRLKKAVYESKMPKDTWEDFKACVMKCDDDYWKTIEQEAAERKLFQALQSRYRSHISPGPTGNHPRPASHSSPPSQSTSNSRAQAPLPATPRFQRPAPPPVNRPPPSQPPNTPRPTTGNPPAYRPRPNHIGPDGRLTAAERQRRMDNGLCLICAQRGHMAADCPSARYRLTGAPVASGSTGTPMRPNRGRRTRANFSKSRETPGPQESK